MLLSPSHVNVCGTGSAKHKLGELNFKHGEVKYEMPSKIYCSHHIFSGKCNSKTCPCEYRDLDNTEENNLACVLRPQFQYKEIRINNTTPWSRKKSKTKN